MLDLNLIGVDLGVMQNDGIRVFHTKRDAQKAINVAGKIGTMFRPSVCPARNRFMGFWVVCCTDQDGSLEIMTNQGTVRMRHPGYVFGVHKISA